MEQDKDGRALDRCGRAVVIRMKYTDPTRQIQISKIGDFFVVDTSIAVTEDTIPKHSTILQELGNTEQKPHFTYLL